MYACKVQRHSKGWCGSTKRLHTLTEDTRLFAESGKRVSPYPNLLIHSRFSDLDCSLAANHKGQYAHNEEILLIPMT